MPTTVTMTGPGTTTIVDDVSAVLLANLSPAGLKTPGTPVASLYVAASSLNDIAPMLSDVVKQQKELNANLVLMNQALSTLTAHIGVQTTTAQLSYLDQAKNNQFNQQTTNAALERAELPKTVVTPGDFKTTVVSTVQDVANLELQSQLVSVTQSGLASVQGYAIEQGKWLVEKAFVASGAAGLWNTVKEKWAKLFDPVGESRQKVVDTKAVTRTTLLGVPETQLPPKT